MFADRARDGIAEAEGAEDETRPLERATADQRAENDKKQQYLEHRFVELARMARRWPAGRKHHSPRQVGRSAPKLAVDKVGDASEKNPNRSRRAGDIAERKDEHPRWGAEKTAGRTQPVKPAVKENAP